MQETVLVLNSKLKALGLVQMGLSLRSQFATMFMALFLPSGFVMLINGLVC